MPELAVVISNDILGSYARRGCLAQLLCNPGLARMTRYPQMDDSPRPSSMMKNTKAVRNHKSITGKKSQAHTSGHQSRGTAANFDWVLGAGGPRACDAVRLDDDEALRPVATQLARAKSQKRSRRVSWGRLTWRCRMATCWRKRAFSASNSDLLRGTSRSVPSRTEDLAGVVQRRMVRSTKEKQRSRSISLRARKKGMHYSFRATGVGRRVYHRLGKERSLRGARCVGGRRDAPAKRFGRQKERTELGRSWLVFAIKWGGWSKWSPQPNLG